MRLDRLLGSRESRCLGLILFALAAGFAKAPRLLEPEAISSMLLALPLILIVASGQMPVIVSRGIDLSVGSVLGMGGISAGLLFRHSPNASLWLAAGVALAVGAALGLANGVLVSKAKIPPIIVTLGTLSAYRGLTFIVSGSKQIDSSEVPTGLTDLAQNGPVHFGAVVLPWLVVVALAVAALVFTFSRFTSVGRDLFAIGSNPVAAKLRGVRVERALTVAYTLSGALAGLAGLLYAGRYGFVNPGTAGQGMELTVIAAAVIGGCDVRGGSGSMLGVLYGCCLLAVVGVALAVLGIAADWQVLAYGAIILVALILDALGSRKARTVTA